MPSSLREWCHPGTDWQDPADVAVIIPTVVRTTLIDAVQSVFAQRFDGRVQILVGIDRMLGDIETLEAAARNIPSNCRVQVLDPGFSTSIRHGGLFPSRDGGALRTILSYLANAPLLCYLDDDNWWGENHLASLRNAIEGLDWAFSWRWYVHPVTRQPICVDEWESVGPGRGIFNTRYGGFIDPNCLMIDRAACGPVLHWWTQPVADDPVGMSADRNIFYRLANDFHGRGSDLATAYYVLSPSDSMHKFRLEVIGDRYTAA